MPKLVPTHPRRVETLASAAARMGVHTKTLRVYIADGKIPAYRLGDRLLRLDVDDVDALLTQIPTASSPVTDIGGMR